jgi:hypothetical protein
MATKTICKACFIAASLTIGSDISAQAMEFTEHFNGAMRIDGNSTWISAEGEITADSPAVFERFLSGATTRCYYSPAPVHEKPSIVFV